MFSSLLRQIFFAWCFYEDQQVKETNIALSLATASPNPFSKEPATKNPIISLCWHPLSVLAVAAIHLCSVKYISICRLPKTSIYFDQKWTDFRAQQNFFSFPCGCFFTRKKAVWKTRKVSLMCMCHFKIKAPSHTLGILPRSSNYRIICDFKHEFFGCCSCLALLH